MRSRLVIEMTTPLTAGFDSTQRNAAWAKVAPPLSYGRMSFRRAPINVFMVSTPTRLSAALREHARELGLHRDGVEVAHQPLVEGGILSEVVGHEDDVDQVVVERVVEALDEPAGVARHAREADLALALAQRRRTVPLGVLHARHVVHRVVEVDVDVVGAQPAQAALERSHRNRPAVPDAVVSTFEARMHAIADCLRAPCRWRLSAAPPV